MQLIQRINIFKKNWQSPIFWVLLVSKKEEKQHTQTQESNKTVLFHFRSEKLVQREIYIFVVNLEEIFNF